MKFLAIIFNGFEELEAMAPFALLRRAGADLTIASNNTTVTGSHKISLTDITSINDINIDDYDVLIIPGGAHFKYMATSDYVSLLINEFHKNNKWICAICAAPTLLGNLGLLKGKNYTCFTSMNKDFGGNYTDKGVEVDGKLITAKSVAFSLDFAYKIIELTMGEEILNNVKKQIYYEK